MTNGNCIYVTVIKLINGFGFLLVVVRIIKLKEKYKNGSSSIIVNIYFNCSYLKEKKLQALRICDKFILSN